MPAKKNDHAGVEEGAPVKSSTNSADEQFVKLRQERRSLESELGLIDEQIRTAINSGDLESLDTLVARKSELPRLFIAASTAEMTARQAIFSIEDSGNLKRLRAAEQKRDELKVALVAMRRKHEEEIAALNAELHATIAEVGSTYSAIQSMRDLGASCDAGFKRSMAAIAGV